MRRTLAAQFLALAASRSLFHGTATLQVGFVALKQSWVEIRYLVAWLVVEASWVLLRVQFILWRCLSLSIDSRGSLGDPPAGTRCLSCEQLTANQNEPCLKLSPVNHCFRKQFAKRRCGCGEEEGGVGWVGSPAKVLLQHVLPRASRGGTAHTWSSAGQAAHPQP